VAGVLDDVDPGVVHLMALWVHPAVRGTGAGDALVDAVISWGGRTGAHVVRLHVVDANAPARRLYERHGFRPTGRVVRSGGPDTLEIEMERPCPGDGSDRR
jgi:ribosomal protein S18 acetylase RimI-like enzyme